VTEKNHIKGFKEVGCWQAMKQGRFKDRSLEDEKLSG
jgi:hypothetical protein